MSVEKTRVLYAEACNVAAARARVRHAESALDAARRSNVPDPPVGRAIAMLESAQEDLRRALAEQRRVAAMWTGVAS